MALSRGVAARREGPAGTRARRRRADGRLVASSRSPGHAPSRATMSAAAESTCSTLSSSSSVTRPAKYAWSCIRADVVPSSRKPSDRATVGRTREGSRTPARPTTTTPASKRGAASRATWRARRVLPTPPTPVIVTRRTPGRASASRIAMMSSSRPTRRVSGSDSVSRSARPPARRTAGSTGNASPATAMAILATWAVGRARCRRMVASSAPRCAASRPSASVSSATV